MIRILLISHFLTLVPSFVQAINFDEGDSAHYLMSPANEHQTPPLSDMWIQAEGEEKHEGKSYQWWRMSMRKFDGTILGIRVLSEQIPMTADSAPGKVIRYQFNTGAGKTLEYFDKCSGLVMLPELAFPEGLLPFPAPDARYIGSYATSGNLLGHVLTRTYTAASPPVLDFNTVQRMEIRTDFSISSSRPFRDNGVPVGRGQDYTYVPLSSTDIAEMHEAGFNYFRVTPELRSLVQDEPVFFYVYPTQFPEDLYRPNYTHRFYYIDEPMTRLEWTYDLKERPVSPEMVSNALRTRVQGLFSPSARKLELDRAISPGLLEIFHPPGPSWETHFWSAWYQMQAGASAVIHEGRYAPGTWGYTPEELLGKDLSILSPTDEYNFVYAFLRGAARSFNGQWGTSLYGQAWDSYRLPAFIRAYDMGASHFWFWTSGAEFHVPHAEQLRIARALCDHAKAHPRPDEKTLLRKASVGIALPPGYAFSWDGTWGMRREQANAAGVSYGDISAAMAWEGFICSRSGIEFDFLVNHPGIEKLGYKQLVIVQEDGSLKEIPNRAINRLPRNLRIEWETIQESPLLERPALDAQHSVRRAGPIAIDGQLEDWQDAEWIELNPEGWRSEDISSTHAIRIPSDYPAFQGNSFLGMTFTPTVDDLLNKYGLENWPEYAFAIITGVTPGSPADIAGIKEGDLIQRIGGRNVREINQWKYLAEKYKAFPGEIMDVQVRRSGRHRYQGRTDLSGKVAFLMDDQHFYFAALVQDDVFSQQKSGLRLWENDSVQLALDSILDRRIDHYGENGHEFILALKDGQPEVWRNQGRRGQLLTRIVTADIRIVRDKDRTTYELSIPWVELRPMSPGIWPRFGANVVLNDNDGDTDNRKGWIELSPNANGKDLNPHLYQVFDSPPAKELMRTDAALFWSKRCTPPGGSVELQLITVGPETNAAKIKADLISLDSPDSKPVQAETQVPITPEPSFYTLRLFHDSPAGRYRMSIAVRNPAGELITEETQNVYVYPK